MDPSRKEVVLALKALLDSLDNNQYNKLQEFLTAYSVSMTDNNLGYIAKIVTSMAEMIDKCKQYMP